MTKNAQLGILLTLVGFLTGVGASYWYWSTHCAGVTAKATAMLGNIIGDLNQRMDSSRGPIFPIPLARSDGKEMRDVIQKFTTDLNGNLYMLVPIPTTAQVREVKPAEQAAPPETAKADKPVQENDVPQTPSE